MQKIVIFDKPIEGSIVNDSVNTYLHQGWNVKDVKETGSIFGKITLVLEKEDAFPVRCKNCVWAEKCGEKYECMHDHGLVELLDGDDFCSYGEVKE